MKSLNLVTQVSVQEKLEMLLKVCKIPHFNGLWFERGVGSQVPKPPFPGSVYDPGPPLC